jgi:hypothetical protein
MKMRIEPLNLATAAETFGAPARPSGPPLAPLLAGARARGVADGLEWLGLAAVLLDDRGEALHVNAGAVELLGEELFIASARLCARVGRVDHALAEAVGDALTAGASTLVDVPTADGMMVARVAPMGARDDDPYQLLRVVVILERREAGSYGSAARH